MFASRKLEDHRHAADEDLYLKLEQYRQETQRAQTDFANSQAEVLRLRSTLRQVLEESSSENEKHVLARDFLTRRSLAAEEALHALRRSLPLLGGPQLRNSDRGEGGDYRGGVSGDFGDCEAVSCHSALRADEKERQGARGGVLDVDGTWLSEQEGDTAVDGHELRERRRRSIESNIQRMMR